MKTDPELHVEGFTQTGIERYKKTAKEFCELLFDRAIVFGDRDKLHGFRPEITHEHVRQAAETLAKRKKPSSVWERVGNIAEYLCAILAGVGGGRLDQPWGQITCIAATAVGVILISVRLSKQE